MEQPGLESLCLECLKSVPVMETRTMDPTGGRQGPFNRGRMIRVDLVGGHIRDRHLAKDHRYDVRGSSWGPVASPPTLC